VTTETTTVGTPSAGAPTDAAPTDAATTGAITTDATAAATSSTEAAPTDPAATAPADAAAGAATPPAAASGPLKSERITLTGESGKVMTVGVKTPMGKHTVRQFGEDFAVWDTEQLTLERGADGTWQIVPGAGTTNETLVNGVAITAPQPLNAGDVIAVGRAEKGVARLPLTVQPG
jgi:hypothetical protein